MDNGFIGSYINAGFRLIPLKKESKLPLEAGWSHKTYTTPQPWVDRPEWGVGVHLGASELISLDIDSPDDFQKILDEFGFEIPPTLKIIGRNPRYIFRSKNKIYRALSLQADGKSKCIFEIRAGNHYDCLPPSIHPQTLEPYTYEGSIDNIAPAPAWIEILATDWERFKPQLLDAVLGTSHAVQHAVAPRLIDKSEATISQLYCDRVPLSDALKKYGYKQKSNKRWLSPYSGTGIAGVYIIAGDRCWIHHASDPLCSNASGRPVNAFDLYTFYEHGGDYKKAYKECGEKRPRGRPRLTEPTPESEKRPRGRPRLDTINQEPPPPIEFNEMPFKFLGYDTENIYILPKIVGAVVTIKIASMKKLNLLQVADLNFWCDYMPNKKMDGVDWDRAFDDMIKKSYAAGLFDPSKIRGVGAWFDSGKAVIHCGKTLIENGKEIGVTESTGKYIYEIKNGIDVAKKALSTQDTKKITDILSRINFENEYDHKLLAGFAALAPICGALEWRPHVWLSAARGSGKTWIQSNILAPLIGDIGLSVQGSTTEAGLRQFLSSDARPVLFDEAESENPAAQERMQKIIEFARQSSSDSSAQVVKGSKDGSCVRYSPRSMFLMSSINAALKQSADLSRFTMINLAGKSKDFKQIDIDTNNLFNDVFCSQFRRRMFDLIPTIRKNAKKLAEKIADIKNDRRLGDQLGALIAGYVATQTDRVLADDEAVELAKDFVTFANKNDESDEADELQTINHLLQTRVKADLHDRTIGELVDIASCKSVDDKVSYETAKAVLARHGFRCEKKELYIANNNAELKKLLIGTAWGNGWKHLLIRIKGARKGDFPVDFAGSRQRFVAVDISELNGG